MKQYFFTGIRLTAVCTGVFMGAYSLLILAIAQAAPNKGRGEIVVKNGKTIGYKIEGQSFTQDQYFYSRPSAVTYNAAGSAGSNKGPNNPEYLQQVKDRLDTFLAHNPGVVKTAVPSELITASGSGLDPDLSPEGAYVQVKRIAKIRHMTEAAVTAIINKNIEQPLPGLFGTRKVNVLKLNMELEKF